MITKNQIQANWSKLTGTSESHTLEARIFHVTCLFTIFLFTLSVFFNYIIGLHFLSVLLAPSVIIACGLYYVSRVRFMHQLGVTIFCVLGNILFIIFFMNNSGINGPSLVIYLLFFFLVISIVPVRQRLIWVTVNLVVALLLIAYQYHFPELVPVKHADELRRSIDFAYVYFFTLIIVYFIITSIINSYNKEKTLAENRAELLEQSNQSKNKLFSILAHDLRSPLNSIQNFLEISLEDDIQESDRKMIHSSLLRETRYTRQMLANLLSWSKTQMDGVAVNLVLLELGKVLEPTISMQSILAAEKSIVINNQISTAIKVTADHDMLELIIRNLISNAIKFTPVGGQITLSTTRVGDECWITVKDNGVGMTKATAINIFTMQSSSTYGTNNEKGVGLGLVLCKEFIGLQQGSIWVESDLGLGSTFFISLKLAEDGNHSGQI